MTVSFESKLLGLLQAMQEQRTAFLSESKRLADRCRAEHHGGDKTEAKPAPGDDVEMPDAGAAPVLCRACYNEVLALIHHTYASPARPQWYEAQKASFVDELDRRLDAVRSLAAPLAAVDEWIAAQKRAWLRGQLQDAVALQTAADVLGVDRAAFQAQLADPAVALADVLQEAADKTGSLSGEHERERIVADVDAAAKRLQQTSSGAEKGVVYRDTLFPGSVPDLPAVRALEKKMLSGDVGLDEGVGAVLRDLYGGDDEEARAAKAEKHRKRLAELLRAKAAHEAQKLKKMKPVDVPYFLQDDTPCAACGKAADPQKSPFCTVCFLEVDYCLRENQTVWCSAACMKEDYARHLAASHPCAAGSHCARSKPEADIARQEPRYYFCRECVLSFSIGTVYCNERCASRDFQRHRETVHLPNREMRAESRDDRSELSYSSYAKLDYTAADIAKHLLSLREALATCQKKHPDWDLAETKVKMTLPWA